MKTRTLGTLLLAALTLPTSALAQEYGPEDTAAIESVREVDATLEEVTDEDPLVWEFRLTSEIDATDNLDLRPRDETGLQRGIDTDDRHTFGYTSFSASADYQANESTRVAAGAIHSGLWGNDQLGTTNAFGGFLYIWQLYAAWAPLADGPVELEASIGRQPFSIGGVENDFFFKDIIDGVTVEVGNEQFGRLRILAVDLMGSNARPEDINFADYLSGEQLVENFRGDTNVFRFGGVYELLDLVEGLELRAFGFYADVGATVSQGTGADRTDGGARGNFADNDYTWMAGGRGGYTFDAGAYRVKAFGEYAYSGGIDRKETTVGYYDVNTEGQAFGGGVSGGAALGDIGLELRTRYFYADGAKYTEGEGLPFSHGFVSMKGSQVGGLTLDRFAGWHPSAYVGGRMGVNDDLHDQTRKAGTQAIHGGIGVDWRELVAVDFDVWHLIDTGSTNFDLSRIDQMGELPPGFSQADLQAQERLGKTLGTELDAAVTLRPNDVISFYAIGSIFLPGEFYETEIQRTVGTALGAPGGDASQLEDFWAVSGGTTLEF